MSCLTQVDQDILEMELKKLDILEKGLRDCEEEQIQVQEQLEKEEENNTDDESEQIQVEKNTEICESKNLEEDKNVQEGLIEPVVLRHQKQEHNEVDVELDNVPEESKVDNKVCNEQTNLSCQFFFF